MNPCLHVLHASENLLKLMLPPWLFKKSGVMHACSKIMISVIYLFATYYSDPNNRCAIYPMVCTIK